MDLDNITRIDEVWMQARLEDAVQTHDILPAAVRLRVRTMYDTISLHEEIDPDEESPFSKLSATSKDIKRMEQTIDWLQAIPADSIAEKRMKMNVLFLRARTRGGKNHSWRKIADSVGVSHTKAEYMHKIALSDLVMSVYRKHVAAVKKQ